MALGLILVALVQQSAAAPPRTPYWQQRMTYEISASLDEPRGVLSGTERVNYINHSPDTLTSFSLHLYLNAFRPGSRWADRDSIEKNRRFNDLKDPDYAFNHVTLVRIMGQAVTPIYPFAPDSTIVRFGLPHPLAPGDSLVAEMNWDARPSTLPRRQGRQGRAFDFAQWYPRVVAYDRYGWEEHPLYPGGEFYGDFATFLVKLDVPEDQVVGATGVPICGDPGWEKANRVPGVPVDYQRHFYSDAPYVQADSNGAAGGCAANPHWPLHLSADPPAPGRKVITLYAEDVHHFAMSLRPDYRYEGGHFGDVAVHVLYQPGDTATWGNGIAVKRTETALAWLDRFFGKFAWPQITNVHRIEGGGTEFPMMIHDGSADQGLIVHELGHNYVMGILANNEWKEGFLDEGFTSFQTALFNEATGRGTDYPGLEQFILGFDLDGYSEPTSLVSEDYRDFSTYNTMIYARGELFYYQLRNIVGDSTMHQIMLTYYDRWKLKHVNEEAFRDVAEEVSHRDLSTFFAQWLHTTELYDYAAGKVKRSRLPDGRWRTRVEVRREAPGMFPVEVAAINGKDTTVVIANGRAEREWVELVTATRPREIVVDPRLRSHDWNMLNNRRRSSWIFGFTPVRKQETRIDHVFSTTVRRDRVVQALLPTVWYNDKGGVTLGLRSRDNYLGRFEQNVGLVTRSTGWNADHADPKDWGIFVRLKNPVWLRTPRGSQLLEVMHAEGRDGVLLSWEQATRNHLGFGPSTVGGLSLRWLATPDTSYLDPGYYENAGTIEGQLSVRSSERRGRWLVSGRISAGGGIEYLNQGPGLARDRRFDTQPYFRGTFEATARRALGRFGLALRAYAGVAQGKDDVVKQRQIYLAGADPYEQINNPFTRSRGALLVGEDIHYQVPGGGNLRGYDARLSASQVYAINAELERTVVSRPTAKLFNRVAVALFGDVALSDADLLGAGIGDKLNGFGDGGIGLRAEHRIGSSRITTRVDFPLFVSRPLLAQDRDPKLEKTGFRWVVSFAPAF